MPVDLLSSSLYAVGALGALYWGVPRLAHAALLKGLRPERLPHLSTPEDHGVGAEQVQSLRIPTANHRHLHALLARPSGTTQGPWPLVVGMHGWGANAATLLPLVAPLNEAGIAVLLVDARCHGLSDEDQFTSLPRFAEDIDAALQWAQHQPDLDAQRVALTGHSVGAGAALLVAARRRDIRAVLSLSAFAHPAEVMRRWLRAHHIPQRVIGGWVLSHVQRVIGVRFDDIAPLTSAARLRCPVLFVHGQDDLTVPPQDAVRLHAVTVHAAAQLLLIPGGHDLNQGLDARHAPVIQGFLQRAFSGAIPPTHPASQIAGDDDVHKTPLAAPFATA
ncbi:alpha/beta fold hydrolase [Aquabacterium fontiphilum]|jgi:dipeptidyl aminopeptidase/acylaminoacyl peptidase|uniref:alpha/beta hydrolase family protein n=1 Tax=Aquabacterium fontiphilum TaxID=450365 RepID=UPI0013764B02|nr:alpha/beta fold hydrolase [Aquabacterium fontiphilum]NBD20715.1 alpha/beta fold hydrolase [Aquabacterium fontiphilum]